MRLTSSVGRLAARAIASNNAMNKQKRGEQLTLEEMELAQARLDLMIRFLQRRLTEGANRQTAEDIARYQQWHNDLDVEIGLERIRRGTFRRRGRRRALS
jgi:hypothetical protein